MNTLLVGFDSAWTMKNKGAVVGAVISENQQINSLGFPIKAGFEDAASLIEQWQRETHSVRTIIAIDQPTIVANTSGQRPVENIVSSCVSKRFGGMQPANRGRTGMFDAEAPIWPFLERFGGPARFDGLFENCLVVETYPVLEIIARSWTVADQSRYTGRLPKYNPAAGKKFNITDWTRLCGQVESCLMQDGVTKLAEWCSQAGQLVKPRKLDQDGLDACICLLVAIGWARGNECLVVGDDVSGYITVSANSELREELEVRCLKAGWEGKRVAIFRPEFRKPGQGVNWQIDVASGSR
jgi:predicted RNase H-like nuclease